MKKSLIILGICSVIMACNNSKTSSTAEDTTSVGENQSATAQQSSVDTNVNKVGTAATTASAGSSKGQELINKSDCLTCHKVDVKLVGPAYVDVANKYSATDANIDMLVGKIIAGGSGNWGEIPMAPHPNITKEDAKEMVEYVLSLKTK